MRDLKPEYTYFEVFLYTTFGSDSYVPPEMRPNKLMRTTPATQSSPAGRAAAAEGSATAKMISDTRAALHYHSRTALNLFFFKEKKNPLAHE